jgi:hypothetical protein
MALPNFNSKSKSNLIFRSSFQLTFISLDDDLNGLIDYDSVDVSDYFINIGIRQNEFFFKKFNFGDNNQFKSVIGIILEVHDKIGNVISKKLFSVDYFKSSTNFNYNVVDILYTEVEFKFKSEVDVLESEFDIKSYIREYRLNILDI